MVKSCSLLPMLTGAVVFPLSANALETVEFDVTDVRPMLVSATASSQARPEFPKFAGAILDDPFGLRQSQPVLQFPAVERPSEAIGLTSSEVTSVLEDMRLTDPVRGAPALGPAAQFAAALAVAGLVARRRLAGH